MSLDTTVSPEPAAAKRRAGRRAERFSAQEVLWSESGLKRVRHCGRYVHGSGIDADVGVPVRLTTQTDGSRVAGFGGLQTCGSTWSCPVCSAKIAAERQSEVEQAVRSWTSDGGGVIYATFTMRHHAHNSLASVWDALSTAWNGVTSGAAWIGDQECSGLGVPVSRVVKSGKRKGQRVTETRVPWVRVVEVTNGANGWHVHIHCLFFIARPVQDATADEWVTPMWTRWENSLISNGYPAPERWVGLDVQAVNGDTELIADAFGRYFTKNTYDGAAATALEMTRADLKDSRHGNRTPFQILKSVYDTGDAGDLATWHEWERGSKGRRQMTWSVGARVLLGLVEEERTDEEIAADDHGGEIVAWLSKETYAHLVARRGRRAQLLAHLEEHGAFGFLTYMHDNGLVPDPPPEGYLRD